MSYCCAGNCKKKRTRDSSDVRHFLRLYKFPKDSALARRWVSRIDRRPQDVNVDTMVVCSEHFQDEDFKFSQYQNSVERFQRGESLKGINITLKEDSIPNTDRSTGLKRLRAFQDEGQPSERRRRRNVGLSRIDDLIAENELILGGASDNIIRSLDEGSTQSGDEVQTERTTDLSTTDQPLHFEITEPSSTVVKKKSVLTQTDFNCKCFPTGESQFGVSDSDSDECEHDSETTDPSFQPVEGLRDVSYDTWRESRYTLNKKNRLVRKPISAAIVGMEQLKLLFVYCLLCGSRVLSTVVRYSGVSIAVDYVCAMGHQHTWRSGDMFHRKSYLNVLVAASAMMSGVGFSKLKSTFLLMEIPFMSSKKFYQICRSWLFPVILKEYRTMKEKTISTLKTDTNLILSGDGQFDSPGYSAKYCTYTGMQSDNDKVVDFFIIQKGQYDGELEKQACEELINVLVNEDKLPIKSFVSDCHSGIAKMIREQYPDIKHSYDIWHTAKRLRKKLDKAGKKHPKIVLWTGDLINHFWWSCQACKGDPDLLLEIYHSCLYHVLNIHSWGNRYRAPILKTFRDMRGTKPYPKESMLEKKNQKCLHERLTRGVHRKGKWFAIKDPDFLALFKIVTDTRLSNDMKHCNQFLHTGALESFHSSKLKYLPKMNSYKMNTHIVMTLFTALEHNYGLSVSTKSHPKAAYSRAQKKYVLKNCNVKDTSELKKNILKSIKSNLVETTRAPGAPDLSSYIRRPIPNTFHRVEKPKKDELLKQALSRMKKK